MKILLVRGTFSCFYAACFACLALPCSPLQCMRSCVPWAGLPFVRPLIGPLPQVHGDEVIADSSREGGLSKACVVYKAWLAKVFPGKTDPR